MDEEFTSCAQSQDILATLTHRQVATAGAREPWKREFRCDRVCFDAIVDYSHQCSAGSTGSRVLPSLREEYSDFAQLGPISFPTPLLHTPNGIEFIFGRLFKVFRRLSSSPSAVNMKEFMQVLGLVEFTGMDVGITGEMATNYRILLSRFLLKVGALSKIVSSIPVGACSQNIPLHAVLFSWSAACKLLSQKYESNDSAGEGDLLTLDSAFVVLLDGLAVLRQNCGSAIPCSCVQAVLLELYKTQSTQLLQSCFHIVQCLTKGECPFPSNLPHVMESLVTTSENFLLFFSEAISHLIDIRLITSDEIMARFVLLAGMGDLLCDTALLSTCNILLSFIRKHNLKGLGKIRKSASKFVTKILQTLDTIKLPELEKLSRGDPALWADCVTASFKYCVAEEPILIVFLTKLLSDEQLSSCRGIIINRYSSVKLLIGGCVLSSMLSMLLALVARIDDWEEIAVKLCEWIAGAVPRANETQCHLFFNALDAFDLIASKKSTGNKANIVSTLTNCMNSLLLPERSRVFRARYLSLIRSNPKQLSSVDVNRFVTAVPVPELLEFLYSLVDIAVEIPGSVWDKAACLLASNPTDPKLRDFVVNQISIGLEIRSPYSIARFKSTMDKMNSVQPDPEFLFSFCNGVLSRLPSQFPNFAVQLLPLWIYAVLGYSTSREMDTKRFTSLIWDHIMRLLDSVVPCAVIELSPGNSETSVLRFFEILGSITSSTDIRKIVADSVPCYLANQIAALLKNDDKEVQERIIRVCGEMLRNIGHTLLTIAETDAQRTGLNRTAFVILTQAVITKIVKGSMDHDFLLEVVPTYVSALMKLPYRIFVYSRIKDLLFKFGSDPAISPRISIELASSEGTGNYNQLIKDSDQRLKKFFTSHG